MGNTVRGALLEAESPFELREDLSADVPEATVRAALATGEMGFLHSFTPGTSVDGPGVRVVALTSGCSWHCRYCHNPDAWTMTNGMLVPMTRVLEELRAYRDGSKATSDGLTVSGGEPLMQHRFAAKLFGAASAMGLHTALNTNGYYGDKLSDGELESIDLVLLDIKGWDPGLHRRLTGMDVEPTLTFARRLASRYRPVWIRYVLVPGLTDRFDDIAEIARFASHLGNVERVDVLPFHQHGRYKWKQLGIAYTLEHTEPPCPELVDRARDVFRASGLYAV
jgi:pyruvate formate lyase activating enzyme